MVDGEMKDYRDDHSPDIALLLTLARTVKALLTHELDDDKRIVLLDMLDAALKPFEHYPDPIQQQLQDETQLDHDAAKDGREWTGA
jgi:hypothetical protein